MSYPDFAVEEGDHVVGPRYEWPPWLFFNPQHWIAFNFLCVLATSHEIFHRPQFAVVGKICATVSPRGQCAGPPGAVVASCVHDVLGAGRFPTMGELAEEEERR
jgi:hypothetical protein